MSAVLATTLAKHLDWEVRAHFERTNAALWRELDYLSMARPKSIADAREQGWSVTRLRVVATLNAFNRVVLGPLAAVTRRPRTNTTLGRSRTVQYGTTIRIDSISVARLESTLQAYDALIAKAHVQVRWLFANTASDIIYLITHPPRDTTDE